MHTVYYLISLIKIIRFTEFAHQQPEWPKLL